MTLKRSIKLNGRPTSVSLEDEFWTELRMLAADKEVALSDLVAEIAATPERSSNLSSALRVYVLNQAIDAREWFRSAAMSDAQKCASAAEQAEKRS